MPLPATVRLDPTPVADAASGVAARLSALPRLLVVAGLLAAAAALVSIDVLAGGWLTDVDHGVASWSAAHRWPGHVPLATVVAAAGQRGPVAIVVAGTVLVLALRRRSWRPVLLPAVAVGALNVVVGALKFSIGRTAPYSGHDLLFAGGTLFPSGHSANSVLMWGSLAVVLFSAGTVRRRWLLVVAVAGVSVSVGAASIYLDTHWVSDILGGWLVGGSLLAVLAAVIPLPRPAHGGPAGR